MPAREYSTQEKRRFLRIPASANIQFRRIGHVLNHHKLSKDLSISGIRFLSDQFIPMSEHIKVELELEQGEMPVEFVCKVAWVKSLFEDEVYEVGAEVCEISQESRDKLNTYIAINIPRNKTGE